MFEVYYCNELVLLLAFSFYKSDKQDMNLLIVKPLPSVQELAKLCLLT